MGKRFDMALNKVKFGTQNYWNILCSYLYFDSLPIVNEDFIKKSYEV